MRDGVNVFDGGLRRLRVVGGEVVWVCGLWGGLFCSFGSASFAAAVGFAERPFTHANEVGCDFDEFVFLDVLHTCFE